MKKFIFLNLVLMVCLSLTSLEGQNLRGKEFSIEEGSSIAILPVRLYYMDQLNDTLMPPERFESDTTAYSFHLQLDSLFQQKTTLCEARATSDLWSHLQDFRKVLFKSSIKPEVLTTMKQFAQESGCRYLLATELRVKVGQEATWVPLSVIIIGKTHYTRVKAILFDLETGAARWRNDTEFNGIPVPGSKKINEAIQNNFSTLKTKES